MMGRTAGFQCDNHRWQLLEELDHLAPAEPLAENRLFCGVNTVKLEEAL